MMDLLFAAILAVVTNLYVGDNKTLEEGDIETIVFIKKHPTFQIKLYNIHANNRDQDGRTPDGRGAGVDY